MVAMTIDGLFVVHGRLLRRKIERLRRVGRRTSAVVVDYEYDGASTPFPLVQFQAPDGHLVTARTDFGGSFVPDIGEHVSVLYDPERPEEAHIDSKLSNQVNNLVGVIGWIMIVGPAIAAVTVLVIFRDALTTAPSEVASASQNDVTFDKLRTGDCIDPAPPEFDIISTLPVVPCTQLHDGQVLGTRYLGEDEWPGDDAIYDRSDKECSIQFEAFVGIPVDDSRFDLSWYSPDQESWQGGDHLVACVVSDPRGQTVGTLRAARR